MRSVGKRCADYPRPFDSLSQTFWTATEHKALYGPQSQYADKIGHGGLTTRVVSYDFNEFRSADHTHEANPGVPDNSASRPALVSAAGHHAPSPADRLESQPPRSGP